MAHQPGNAMPEESEIQISAELLAQAEAARNASRRLAVAGTDQKNKAITEVASLLATRQEEILAANKQDLEEGKKLGLSKALLDRLALTESRIKGMIEGLENLLALPDPVGEVTAMWKRPNGLQIGQIRVPLGVVGMIYEARPNVTIDAIGLCAKTGNAVVLRGGKEALASNRVLVRIARQGYARAGLPVEGIQLVENPDRALARQLMRLTGYIDLLIPRGGAGLINTVVSEARVPVIETGVGNCHVYVDESARLPMALDIVINAKTSKPSVCNAAETLLVHRSVAADFLPQAVRALQDAGVEVRGCPETRALCPSTLPATEQDWSTEFLDLIIAVRVVNDLDQAIEHINHYGSRHSEAIITENYTQARRFLDEVDAACVYVNASTRFTDGFEFGFGAEIGISTQKLHARGPMGLKELTSTKFVIYGSGQVR